MSGSSTIDLAGVYGTLGIPAAGNIPGGRSAANTWTDSRGNLWLFGGYGADSSGTLTRLNDLWEYQSSPSPADFQLSLNQPALTIIAGQSGTVTLTVTPENGFNSQVSFACSGLPSEVTCRFSPTFVTPSSSAPTSTLTVATNAANAATRVSIPFSQPPIYVLLFPVLAMIFGVAPRRRRALHGLRLVGLLILLMLDLGVTSCGGDGGNPGPPIGTYTVSVSASTNGAGAIDHTATLSITITQ